MPYKSAPNKSTTVAKAKREKNSVPVPQKDPLFQYVESLYDDAQANRSQWVQKQVKFNKMRMRVKKVKTFPFIGCSNLKLPTAEIKIRKAKAAVYNVIFGVRPIVQAVPPPGGHYEVALKIEKFLDHLIMERMRFHNRAIIAIDQTFEQGFYGMMPYWNLEITERQETLSVRDFSMEEVIFLFDGRTTDDMVREFLIQHFDIDMDDRISDENEAVIKEVISHLYDGKPYKFYAQDITQDIPEVDLIAPERVYVAADAGFDPQKAGGLLVETSMPFHSLQTNAEQFGWDIDGVKEIGDYKGTQSNEQFQRERNKDLQEGIDRLNAHSEMVRVWIFMGWYDLNGDGIKEKAICYFAPDFNKTLNKMGLPFWNGKYNLVKLFCELTDDRWYAHRGLVEIAEDLIKEIDIQHNMKLDQQTIRNAPMFLYRAGQVNPNLIQLIPNQAIPIRGMQPLRDTVDVLNNTNPNAEFSYIQEQQSLEAKLEELTGQIDYTLQSQINKRQPRTLGEVQLQAQNVQQVFALDAGMFIEQFTELFNFIWDLWCQYGSDEYEFNYFGEKGWEKIKLSKEEIQGKYRVVVRGNDRNTNPQVRLQKAEQILLAAKDPVLIQSGVITPPQQIAALKRFYQYLEVENWEELVNMQWKPPGKPPLSDIIKTQFKDLEEGEQAQVLQSMGIQPDVAGMMLSRQKELTELELEATKVKQAGEKGGSNGKKKTPSGS